jgi:site-specific recombinase XerC
MYAHGTKVKQFVTYLYKKVTNIISKITPLSIKLYNKWSALPSLEMDNRIHTFIRNTNKRLVKIGEELGLTMKMTSYVARHCFATIQKNNNAPLAYISEALGDSNLKTTQNYFGRFEDEGLKVFHSGLMEGLVD